MIEITLLGAPMGKERVRFSRQSGRTYTPERTVNYESRLALAAQNVMAGRPLLDGPLRVDIVAAMPVAKSWSKRAAASALSGETRPTKKPDWDNFGKILDALNLVVWVDDSQIVDGRVQKFYSAAPSLTVRVTPLNGGQDDDIFS
jgi:Holliday junction resolvase RusA-like endonuclease